MIKRRFKDPKKRFNMIYNLALNYPQLTPIAFSSTRPATRLDFINFERKKMLEVAAKNPIHDMNHIYRAKTPMEKRALLVPY